MANDNCWANKTPLETGLLLILAVAIPILITLILLYILLPSLCVNCSIKCSTICKNSESLDVPLPPPPPPDSSRSIKLESDKDVCPYSEHKDILKDVSNNIDNAFIAAIIEDVYEDDFSRQRYLCTAAIVTFKWVITGSICFETETENFNRENIIFVRAGSNFWSKGGSVHEVEQILFASGNNLLSPTVAALKLKIAFPKLLSITPIYISSTISFRKSLDVFEMYDWKTNDSMLLPLMFRKKYVHLTKQQLVVLPYSQCKLYSNNQDLFCASPQEKICSNYSYMSFPVTKGNVLLGIHLGKICDIVNNQTVHLIFDTTRILSWLQNITQS